MKNYLKLLALLSFLQLSYGQLPQAQFGFYDKFYTGILSNGQQKDYSKFNGLNLSLWCHYPIWNEQERDYGWIDWEPNDILGRNISEYGEGITNVLSSNAGSSFRTIMDRVKIDRLAYGQRSDYQAEHKEICDPYYDFYSFNTSPYSGTWVEDIVDNDPQHGEGHYVKHCHPDPGLQAGNPVIILKDLNANREQVNITPFSHPYEIDKYHTFYFKPRMRIPVGLPNSTEVCRITIKDWNENTIGSPIIITAENFKVDPNETYNGEYIESFFWRQNPDPLIINANDNGHNIFNPNGYWITDDGTVEEPHACKMDIQVEWYNNCDLWIDYVRVDDEVANRLFKDPPDQEFENWFQWEVSLAESNNHNALKFYIEEFEFNNIPCIAKVNEKLMYYSGNKYKLMCDINVGEEFIIHKRVLQLTRPSPYRTLRVSSPLRRSPFGAGVGL